MIEQFTNYILSMLEIFEHNNFYLYFFVLAMAFLESTPVIGTFTPGTLLLLLFGLIASKGSGMFFMMILVTVIGATLGDIFGYLLGRYGSRFFKEHNKLLKLSHIETGRAFFHKHGGKSIIFGRFIGPIRPVIAMVAGAVHLDFKRFLYLNVTGAVIWAVIYISLGFLFGHNLQLIDRIVSEVVTGILIIGVLIAGFYWYFKKRETIMKD